VNLQEFEELRYKGSSIENIISVDELVNQEDRTLLWGYTCSRDSWHVYLLDREINLFHFVYPKEKIKYLCQESFDLEKQSLVPDKRLFPEACDFEFCKLLKEKGLNLPFTVYQTDRDPKQFHGAIYS